MNIRFPNSASIAALRMVRRLLRLWGLLLPLLRLGAAGPDADCGGKYDSSAPSAHTGLCPGTPHWQLNRAQHTLSIWPRPGMRKLAWLCSWRTMRWRGRFLLRTSQFRILYLLILNSFLPRALARPPPPPPPRVRHRHRRALPHRIGIFVLWLFGMVVASGHRRLWLNHVRPHQEETPLSFCAPSMRCTRKPTPRMS